MSPVLPLDISPTAHIDELVRRWGRVVVPFITKHPEKESAAFCFGSGFIGRYNDENFLVTAAHVVTQMLDYEVCVTNVNGHAVHLKNVSFYTDETNDIAFAQIEDTLVEYNVPTLVAIDICVADDPTHPLDHYLLLGYPETKNRLDAKWGRTTRELLSITAIPSRSHTLVQTNIADPVLFEFDPKRQIDSQLNRIGKIPDLYGMSGGPVLELRGSRPGKHEFKIHVRLAGVLVERHKSRKTIVAASSASLAKLFKDVFGTTATPPGLNSQISSSYL